MLKIFIRLCGRARIFIRQKCDYLPLMIPAQGSTFFLVFVKVSERHRFGGTCLALIEHTRKILQSMAVSIYFARAHKLTLTFFFFVLYVL